jgi:Raf kinase inhibitor-like YbhB/YbcL family protein
MFGRPYDRITSICSRCRHAARRRAAIDLHCASARGTTLQLTSPAFRANDRIPPVHTCDGNDTSPPLAWSGAPSGTKSFALILADPDAPGRTFYHWAIFDIAATATVLGAGTRKSELVDGARQATNDFGRVGYGGPCPPPGRPHHYRFRLLALDVDRLDVPSRARCIDVERRAEPHRLAEATLTAIYGR